MKQIESLPAMLMKVSELYTSLKKSSREKIGKSGMRRVFRLNLQFATERRRSQLLTRRLKSKWNSSDQQLLKTNFRMKLLTLFNLLRLLELKFGYLLVIRSRQPPTSVSQLVFWTVT